MAATSAAIALLATTAAGAIPASALTPSTSLGSATPSADPTDKFTPGVYKELEAQKTTDFWIKLEDKADLSAAEDIADWDARGQYVYDTLTQVASDSQAELVAELDKRSADYTTYWISNRILVNGGTMELATALAGNPEVEEITQTQVLDRVEPVEMKATGDQSLQAVEWGLDAINAPAVWAQGITGQGITVANIDTGVQYDHPALATRYRGLQADGSVVNDYNSLDTSNTCGSSNPCDFEGHGTHTMGTMVGDDGAGNQIGVAPGANWIQANGCATCSDVDLIEGGEWITAPTRTDGTDPDPSMRPDVVNNSWSWDAPGYIDPEWYMDITAAWRAAGIFSAWSAGNHGPNCATTSSPGANISSYAVGAFDSAGDIAGFSSRGPGEDDMIKPSVSAPGVSVRSALPGNSYGLGSGTSMAAPHVAGAVALLWDAAPTLRGDIDATEALLNQTAVDVDATECGGTAENNNVWGEGKLDAAALIAAAPTQGVGQLSGTVTDAAGAPIVGAEVTSEGPTERTATTDADGTFTLTLEEGDYTVEVTAYGYLSQSQPATIVGDETATVTFALELAPTYAVSGTVTAGESPVPGATVTVAPQIDPATTGADGTFTIADVPAGTYTIAVTAGACAAPYSAELVVDGDESVAIALDGRPDAFGYTCTVGMDGAAAGTDLLSLSGDDQATSVALPFPFTFYGQTYDTAHVSTNGHVNFLENVTAYSNTQIPNENTPNAAVYAFWDDLEVDSEAGVYTGTTTVNGVDAFVIEYRNVTPLNIEEARTNFSVTLLADGDVIVGYGDMAADQPRLTGESATVGIENAAGTVAHQYSYNTGSIAAGMSIHYDAPALGSVSGLIRDYNTKSPLEGVAITATASDGDVTKLTTGSDGRYATNLVLDRYTLEIAMEGYETATRNFVLDEEGEALVRNAQLNAPMLEVSTESLAASLQLGGSATRYVRVTNTGSAPAEVDLLSSGGGFEMQGSAASGTGVIKGVQDAATVVASASPGAATTGLGTNPTDGADRLSLASDGKAGDRVVPEVTVPTGQTTITHSASQAIQSPNSASCNNGLVTREGSYLRTFTLSDFGIGGTFDVTQVQFGVETNGTSQPISVRLHSLDGELAYGNMTLIGSADTTVPTGSDGTIITVPVEGTVPSGGTLVVEIFVEDGGWFFIGSNDEGQTAPSYLSSDACGIPEPTDTTEIGFPEMHIVMNVTGDASVGGGLGWLDIQPPSFTLAPGASVRAAVTFTADVDQPGTYTAAITPSAVTPYDNPEVSATMTVKAPTSWGKLTGTVTSDAGEPLGGAVVHVGGATHEVTLTTNADGYYEYWFPAPATLTMNVGANGYIPESRSVRIIKGQTSVYDITLTPTP